MGLRKSKRKSYSRKEKDVKNVYIRIPRGNISMNVVENPTNGKVKNIPKVPYRKKSIPAAVRQQVWLTYVGEQFKSKCKVKWCRNTITVFHFDCGHNVPESRGGLTTIDNLLPICSNCNGSMREHYTIDEWNVAFAPRKRGFMSMCFGKTTSVAPNLTPDAPQK